MISKKTDTTDLAAIIRQAIAERGLSMLAVAKRSGLHYASVHGFVSGYRDLTLQSATKMCRALGLELRPVRRGKRKG